MAVKEISPGDNSGVGNPRPSRMRSWAYAAKPYLMGMALGALLCQNVLDAQGVELGNKLSMVYGPLIFLWFCLVPLDKPR